VRIAAHAPGYGIAVDISYADIGEDDVGMQLGSQAQCFRAG